MKAKPTGPIRVLFMIAEYHRISGGQQSLLQLVRTLPDAGIEPLVCFPKEGRCSEAFAKAGIPILVIPGPSLLTNYGQHLLRRSRFSALRIFVTQMLPYGFRVMREMKRRRISILHCNSVRSLLFAGLFARLFGYKVVWHVRGQLLPFGKSIKRAAESLATSIILVADALRDQISPKARDKCRTIYNGIDQQAIPAGGAQPSLPFELDEDRQVITMVAAVTPFKGHHHLAVAAQIINQQAKAKRPIFLCVGDLFDKAYVEYLRRLIAQYGLDNFHLLGWQENPFPFYQLGDVVVLSTVEHEQLNTGEAMIQVRSGEGLPRSVLEAMYCGRPTVATTVAGTVELIVDGETGILVPPADARALAQALMSILEMSPAERQQMGRRAAARARAIFSTERMVLQTCELYRELAGFESHRPVPLTAMTHTESQAG